MYQPPRVGKPLMAHSESDKRPFLSFFPFNFSRFSKPSDLAPPLRHAAAAEWRGGTEGRRGGATAPLTFL